MSVEAMTWALTEAPGVPSSCVAVLIGLANHADPEGRNAYPSKATLAGYARKTTKQVSRDLDMLVERGVIRVGNQSTAAHLRADRRPVVYDLALPTGGRQCPPVTRSREDISVPSRRSRGGVNVPPVVSDSATGGHTGSNGGTPTSPEPSLNQELTTQPDKAAAVTNAQARELVDTWHHHSGTTLTRSRRNELATVAAAILDDDGDPELLAAALDDWAHRGRTPAFLRHTYDDAAQGRAARHAPIPLRPSTTDTRVAQVLSRLTPDHAQLPGAAS